jgi:hypothetical protein
MVRALALEGRLAVPESVDETSSIYCVCSVHAVASLHGNMIQILPARKEQ